MQCWSKGIKLENASKTFVAANIKFMILRNNFPNLAQFNHVNHPNSPYMKKLVMLLFRNIQTKEFFLKNPLLSLCPKKLFSTWKKIGWVFKNMPQIYFFVKCHIENFRKNCQMDEHDLPYNISHMVCPKRWNLYKRLYLKSLATNFNSFYLTN